jgi:hypothetical protein
VRLSGNPVTEPFRDRQKFPPYHLLIYLFTYRQDVSAIVRNSRRAIYLFTHLPGRSRGRRNSRRTIYSFTHLLFHLLCVRLSGNPVTEPFRDRQKFPPYHLLIYLFTYSPRSFSRSSEIPTVPFTHSLFRLFTIPSCPRGIHPAGPQPNTSLITPKK